MSAWWRRRQRFAGHEEVVGLVQVASGQVQRVQVVRYRAAGRPIKLLECDQIQVLFEIFRIEMTVLILRVVFVEILVVRRYGADRRARRAKVIVQWWGWTAVRRLASGVRCLASDGVEQRIVAFFAYHVRQDATPCVYEPVTDLGERREKARLVTWKFSSWKRFFLSTIFLSAELDRTQLSNLQLQILLYRFCNRRRVARPD